MSFRESHLFGSVLTIGLQVVGLNSATNLNENSNVTSDLDSNNSSLTYTGVVNLSSHKLTDSKLSLLSKGLTYVNTPSTPDIGSIYEDLSKFHVSIKRKIALDKFTDEGRVPKPTALNSSTNPCTPFSHQKFRNPSNWNPQGPMILEFMCFQNESALENTQMNRPNRQNLRKSELSALQSLRKNSDIIIKKADKGSAVVIQNRTDYISEGLRQLADTKFYRQQKNDLTTFHKLLVEQKVTDMFESKEIDKKCAEYLVIDNPRTANFYLLPKIHKGNKCINM